MSKKDKGISYGIIKTFEDNVSKTFFIVEVYPKTQHIISVIGYFNFDFDIDMTDEEVDSMMENFLTDLSKDRFLNGEKINKQFKKIIEKNFNYKYNDDYDLNINIYENDNDNNDKDEDF